MSASNRGVMLVFGAAVAVALGAVTWLVFSGTPAAESGPGTPAPDGTGSKPTVDPGKKGPLKGKPGSTPRPPREKPKPQVLEVAGQVFGPGGEPVAGAAVSVFPPPVESTSPVPPGAPADARVDTEALRELFALDPDEVKGIRTYTGIPALPAAGPALQEVASGTSGDDGKFRIVVRSRGPFRLQARKEGLGSAVASQVFVGVEGTLLRLGTSVALEGRVVAEGASPVEGAVVVVRGGSVERSAVTGSDGTFKVEDLPPGKYGVTAGAAGHAPATIPAVEIPATAGPLEISLASGFSIRVAVMKWEAPPAGWKRNSGVPQPPGPPVEGAQVLLYKPSGGTTLAAVTGPDGLARFERLGDGLWKIGARKEGYGVGFSREVRFKAGTPPEESREIRLQPSVTTPLRVTDESGGAVRNARLYTAGVDEEFDERHSRLVGRTDDEGLAKYVFDEGIPWKSVVWVVTEDGAAAKLTPEDYGSEKEEKVVVHPGRTVQGTVTDGAGKGLPGAAVNLAIYDDEKDIDVELQVYTDAAGKYRFPQVPYGEVTLEVDAADDWDSEDVDGDNRDNPLVRDFRIESDHAPKKEGSGGK